MPCLFPNPSMRSRRTLRSVFSASVDRRPGLCRSSWGAHIVVLGMLSGISATAVMAQSPNDAAIGKTTETLETARQVIVVCPEGFRAALQTWVSHRERGGYQVSVTTPRATAEETKVEIVRLAGGEPSAILLVGDMPVVGTPCNPLREVPTGYVPSTVTRAWGAPPTIASDFLYSDINDDGVPETPVGRLPVDTSDQLTGVTRRIIAYETSNNFGDWRNKIQLTGGIGGFGVIADAAIESVTKSIVTGVLPAETKTSVAYASPGHQFWPVNNSFTDAVVDRYNDGCRFWVYAGHGWIDHLDRVPPTKDGVPVLDRTSILNLRRPGSAAPIALMLSCYTGANDAGTDSLTERMILHDGGPVAIFSGSRVTMPYGNATAAIGLIQGVYEERHGSLGGAWLSAVQKMVATPKDSEKSSARVIVDAMAAMVSPAGTVLSDERQEHTRLYNLLGDPTMRLTHGQKVQITNKAWQDASQQPIDLELVSPLTGQMTLSVEHPLGSAPGADPNHTLVQQMTIEVRSGEPVLPKLRLDDSLRGSFVVRAFVKGVSGWASGASQLVLR